jgi:hypothetical protein
MAVKHAVRDVKTLHYFATKSSGPSGSAGVDEMRIFTIVDYIKIQHFCS